MRSLSIFATVTPSRRLVVDYSPARKFLRANAPELSILNAPGGAPWMGASFAWMENRPECRN